MPQTEKVERETHGFTSTSVSRAWYDAEHRVLEVRFLNGSRWLYERVSPQTWREFKAASSAGKFVHEYLNHHPHRPR